ncbi:MAG: DRTGG domain-containing protein [Pseudomonadota bacterium]
MKLKDVIAEIEGKMLCGEELLSADIETVMASDMMSDVLRYSKPGSILVTGNKNVQAVRTVLIAELRGAILIRNKAPAREILELAQENGIFIALTGLDMFEVCGRLYERMKAAPPQTKKEDQSGSRAEV